MRGKGVSRFLRVRRAGLLVIDFWLLVIGVTIISVLKRGK